MDVALPIDQVFRVAEATGTLVRGPSGDRFVLTAEHVLQGAVLIDAQPKSGRHQVQVVRAFRDEDLALLADHPSWTERPLELLGVEDSLDVGESLWALGFPSGWHGRTPVASTGVVAATSPELWVTAAASWGHSGGPVLVERNGEFVIAGIVLRHGGQSRHDLVAFIANVRSAAAGIKTHLQNPNVGSAVLAGIDFKKLALDLGDTLSTLADFVNVHFRSGFVKALDHRTIRSLLDW